jgi:hypothetical protein
MFKELWILWKNKKFIKVRYFIGFSIFLRIVGQEFL